MKARDIHLSGYDFKVVEVSKDVYVPSILSEDFELAVTMGLVPGYSIVDKFGANPLITSASDPEDVVEQGGIQLLADTGTAPILYLSSSDALDNQSIEITGLDIDGLPSSQFVQLDGQNNVNLNPALNRVFTMETRDSSAFIGTIYCHNDPTPTNGVPVGVSIYGIISPENQRTLIASYTIPSNKVGFLYRGELGIEKEGNAAALAEYARFVYISRREGEVFTVKKRVTVTVSQGEHQDVRPFPDIIPPLTDLKIQVQEVSADLGAWATFHILLIDESVLPENLKTAFGLGG